MTTLVDKKPWRLLLPAALVLLVFALPVTLPLDYQADLVGRAAIFGIVALSLNVLIGYLGQLSLGHQALFGAAAFGSAAATVQGLSFPGGLVVGIAVGAVSTVILGFAALFVRGANFAVGTLVFGVVAEISLFQVGPLAGGVEVVVPDALQSPRAYALLCLFCLALVYAFDVRLLATRQGRAFLTIKNSPQVAQAFSISVARYMLMAFGIAGAMVGLAGSLYAGQIGFVSAVGEFDLLLGITFVLMTVIGGAGNRLGVTIGGMSFGVMPDLLRVLGVNELLVPMIGAIGLVLVLSKYPGGIGQQLEPLRRWVAGGPVLRRAKRQDQETSDADTADRVGYFRLDLIQRYGLDLDRRASEAGTGADAAHIWARCRQGVMIGIGLVAGGLLAIIYTWDRVAQLDHAPAQLPYILSGGLAGVALVVAGGLLALASLWRLLQEAEVRALEQFAAASGAHGPTEVASTRIKPPVMVEPPTRPLVAAELGDRHV